MSKAHRRLKRAARRVVLAWPGFETHGRGPKNLTKFWQAMTTLAKLAR